MTRRIQMNKINIQYASDELVETMRANPKIVVSHIQGSSDNGWVKNFISGRAFVTKKYEIEDFKLLMPRDEKDYGTIYRNAVILYEHLRDLPGYVLSDERFWLWLMLEKFYPESLVMMPITSESTFSDHWLFAQGARRSIFFGVLSRLFFRMLVTVDIENEDPYEFSRFAFENQYRLRNFTWRTYSSEKNVVLGALKGIKTFLQDYDDVDEDNNSYIMLAKYISQLGSAKLLDAMDKEYIKDKVYDKLIEYYGISDDEI